jgi:hypothetical protein
MRIDMVGAILRVVFHHEDREWCGPYPGFDPGDYPVTFRARLGLDGKGAASPSCRKYRESLFDGLESQILFTHVYFEAGHAERRTEKSV